MDGSFGTGPAAMMRTVGEIDRAGRRAPCPHAHWRGPAFWHRPWHLMSCTGLTQSAAAQARTYGRPAKFRRLAGLLLAPGLIVAPLSAQPVAPASARQGGPVQGPEMQADAPSAGGSSAAAPVGPPPVAPDLADLAARAVAGHPAVAAARAGLRAAGGDVKAAKWQRGPSLSVEALSFEGGAPVVRGDNLSLNLAVEQPIWQGGRIDGSIDRARAVRRFASAQVDENALDVALRLTNAYFELARATRRLLILDRGLAEHRGLVASIGRRVEQSVSPSVDLELARARTAQLEDQRASADALRTASLVRLRELLGDVGHEPGAIPFYDPARDHPSAAGAAERAISCSPVRQRLMAEALIARADARLAGAQTMPRLSAVFSSNEVTGERVGLVFRAGVNGGLSQFEAAGAARLRRDAADLRVGAVERDLRDQLNADFAENEAARLRIASSGVAATASRAVTDSYQRQFVVGRRSWLDVMNAALETTQAELAADDAEVSAMATAARIALRTCSWRPDLDPGTQP